MEAEKCPEELLGTVVLFQVECGNAGGTTVACIILTYIVMSQKMFREESRGK